MSENTLPKKERLKSKKIINQIFNEGRVVFVYPFRVNFINLPASYSNQVLFGVSKKKHKRAIKRNRIKRLTKEAYRLEKFRIKNTEGIYAFAIVYIAGQIHDFSFIRASMQQLLNKLKNYEQE